ncbi:hypothetical protein ACTN5O_001259 [Campylobacter jejuni]
MTAYVHIGTPKTGTTSIQKFLSDNRELLLKQNALYVKSLERKNQHWVFYDIVKACYDSNLFDIRLIKNGFYKNLLEKLQQELKENETKKIIFSTEAITWMFNTKKQIEFLKNFLMQLGFSKIYIVVFFRQQSKAVVSAMSENVKGNQKIIYNSIVANHCKIHTFDYKWICQQYSEIFGKKNLIIRLFDTSEFYQGDLLKDFICSIGLNWDHDFILPFKQNESLNLLGMELKDRLNIYLNDTSYGTDIFLKTVEFFTFLDHPLKFQPKKEIIQAYMDYFEESNEWVRKEFFPYKERLFPKQDLTNYKENYELKEMKPEYWDKIAEFIADIVKIKDDIILNKTNIIQDKDKVIANQINQISYLQATLQKNENKLIQIQNLNNTLNKTIKENSTKLSQTQSKLSFQTKYGTAKTRIQNQLSYKLGQALILNSKSVLGFLSLPFIILSIVISHKQEQKTYKFKVKKNPNLALPPLESYPDYNEALKLKNHLSYKLGQALIQANKTWYGGGGISSCCLKLGS